jgi:hypothetical protein
MPIDLIKTPKDLSKKIELLAKVKRFNDPEYHIVDSIPDTTQDHTIRCVYYAHSLSEKWPQIERTLWIHDIAEIETSDVVATKKIEDSETEKKAEKEDLRAAQELLSPEDFILYKEFCKAEAFLKEKSKVVPEMFSLLAKLIDFIDGNLTFSFYFTKWLEINSYDGKIPPVIVFRYSRIQLNKILKQINTTKEIEWDTKNKMIEMLRNEVSVIIELWTKLPSEKIPPIMQEELKKLEILLSHDNLQPVI